MILGVTLPVGKTFPSLRDGTRFAGDSVVLIGKMPVVEMLGFCDDDFVFAMLICSCDRGVSMMTELCFTGITGITGVEIAHIKVLDIVRIAGEECTICEPSQPIAIFTSLQEGVLQGISQRTPGLTKTMEASEGVHPLSPI